MTWDNLALLVAVIAVCLSGISLLLLETKR